MGEAEGERLTKPLTKPPAEPLLRLASKADAASALAALVLLAGALPLALGATPEPAAVLPQQVLLGVAVLALLQAVSGASALGKMFMDGVAAVLGAVLAAVVWALRPDGAGLPPQGAWVVLLGSLVALAAAELERREAGRGYREMARRVADLAQEPATLVLLVKLLLPFALAGAVVLLISEFGAEIATKFAAIFVQYFFNPVGKEVAILCGIHSCPPLIPGPGLHPLAVASFLVFIDATTALFLAWNYRYVLRVPFLGHVLRWVEGHGRKTVVKRPWIRRMAFFGVMFYAAGPFEGTGAIGGTIVGRTIGLDATRTWGAVVSGSVIRTTIFTLSVVAGLHVVDWVRDQPLGVQLTIAAAAATLLVLAFGFLRRRRRARGAPRPEAK